MKDEYLAFKSLSEDERYKALEELWIYHLSKIEEKRDIAASRSQESAWRYWAGQESGFKKATTALHLALQQIERQDENLTSEEIASKVLEKFKISTGDSK